MTAARGLHDLPSPNLETLTKSQPPDTTRLTIDEHSGESSQGMGPPSLGRNLAATSMMRALALVAGLVRVPLLLGILGVNRYAIFLAILGFAQSCSMADFGIQYAVTQLVAELRGSNDNDRIPSLVATAFWTIAAICVVLTGVVLAVFQFGAMTTRILGSDTPSGAGRVLVIGVVTMIAVQPFAVAEAALNGFERIALVSYFSMAVVVLEMIGLITGYLLGWKSILAIGLWIFGLPLASRISATALYIRLSRGTISISPSRFRKSQCRSLLSRGSAFFVGVFAVTVRSSFDTLIVLRVAGPQAAVAYALSLQLFATMLNFMSALPSVLWPRLAAASARQSWDWLARTYRWMVVLTLAAAVVGAASMTFLGSDLIRWWAGRVPAAQPILVLALAALFILQSLNLTLSQTLTSLAFTRLVTFAWILEAAIKILMVTALVRRFGAVGLVLASLGGAFATTVIVSRMIRRKTGNALVLPAGEMSKVVGVGVFLLLGGFSVRQWLLPVRLSIPALLLAALVVSVTSAAFVGAALDREMRTLVAERASTFRQLIRRHRDSLDTMGARRQAD